MEVEFAEKASVFDRLGGKPVGNQLCTYWLAGRCTRNPCRFVHGESPYRGNEKPYSRQNFGSSHQKQSRNMVWTNPSYCTSKIRGAAGTLVGNSEGISHKKSTNDGRKCSDDCDMDDREISNPSMLEDGRTNDQPYPISVAQPKQCKYWVTGNCVHGEKCKDLHAWSYGSGLFTMLKKLKGLTKGVSGICLRADHDKLYSGSKDGYLLAWDCHSGQCAGVKNVGEVGCLITEGPWLFVGLHNAVKAYKLDSEFTVNGLGGLVCSMAMDDGMLFAGTEDGFILVWKWQPDAIVPAEPIAMLKEHNGAVCSLVIGAKKLYSGSRDCNIKVWDLQNFQCLQTLQGHSRDVTAVLCWDCYLLSASLDSTIKAWTTSESGAIEMVGDINVDHEVIALCGIKDAENKSILFCSLNDYTVRLYDLPSFSERGRIFSKREVEVIQIGIDGLFFTGDATGEITVWKLLGSQCPTAS